jgi:hypothetical protein
MANPEKGETSVVIAGVSYTLVMTFNAGVQLQSLLSEGKPEAVPMDAILARAMKGDLICLRALFWALLLEHHPKMTPEQAGKLIDAVGGLETLNKLVDRAVTQSGPDPEDVEALNDGANPPRAAGKKARAR